MPDQDYSNPLLAMSPAEACAAVTHRCVHTLKADMAVHTDVTAVAVTDRSVTFTMKGRAFVVTLTTDELTTPALGKE